MLEYPQDWKPHINYVCKGEISVTLEGGVQVGRAYIALSRRTKRYLQRILRMVLASQLLHDLKETNKCKS